MPSEPMTLADCPVRTTLDVITGKWKPLILFFLKGGTQRYTALRAHLPTASEKVFTQQLRQLERDLILIRTVLPGIPPNVEYRVSPYGETLISVLQQMADWGGAHRKHLETPANAELLLANAGGGG